MSTLAYCTNVHPSETFEEVLRVITGPAREVREGLEQARLPIGLYLSNRASEEIARDRACLETLQAALHASKLDVVTFNGFPYGGFQDKVVKTRVYQPDWSSKQRLEYTKRLAGIFVHLVPESADVSISTLAGGFAAGFNDEHFDAWLRHLAYFANYAQQLESETGRCVRLAIEAEPFTALERASQVMDFFRERVWRASRDFLVKHFGFNPNHAEEALRRHIAVCYDCCHQALFAEDAADFFASARSEELAIAKIQLSSALEIRDRDGLHEIERFVEER
ncbi:MAG: metabolite traffic protein EboE, partial [Planctomycetes bacterium]|nr:metabolite traffic protein EboE [Planctomycetota bacterium]